MNYSHAVTWIDHQHVTIVHFNADDHSSQQIAAHKGAGHLHHKAGAVGSGHDADRHEFFARIAQALQASAEVLVVGPGTAKSEFAHYLDSHDKDLRKRVLGVETASRMSEGQLLAMARQWFNPVDNMRGTPLR